VKQSYYNSLIEIPRHKVTTLWNIIQKDAGKIQPAEKISEINLGIGNTENAKEMAWTFNNLLLLTVIVCNIDSSSRWHKQLF
jgi:hypothetical protein